MEPPLSQGVGYAVVLGLGAAFAAVMVILTRLLTKHLSERQDSEMFMTANRSVQTGLIASAVVSSWTWAATLLTATSMGYEYGVSGGFWYGSCGTVEVLLFTVVAIEIKLKAPNAHTIVELVKVRYGKAGHIVFLVYGLLTNLLVTASLLLGGSAVVTSVTGMNVIAACFLLPVGVLIYTLFGGLKATFLSDWIHTVVIYIILLITLFTVYTSSPLIGSPSKMYDLLTAAATLSPSAGKDGSYMTMDNSAALVTGYTIMIGGMSTVFCDPSYGQKSIAAAPMAAMNGYFIGGLAWWIIPVAFGLSAGLAARALQLSITAAEASAGLVLPYAMNALMGKGGSAAVLLLVFLAVTSSSSAELISVSSVLTYDVYRAYINPKATSAQLVRFSHACVIGFGIFMGAIATILNYLGVSIGWMLTFVGIVVAPGVVSITNTLLWKDQSKLAMCVAGPLGTVTGLASWLGSAHHFVGELNVSSLGNGYACLIGNLVALVSSVIYAFAFSLVQPQNFDFTRFKTEITIVEDESTHLAPEIREKRIEEAEIRAHEENVSLRRASKISKVLGISMTLILVVLWPMPMLGAHYVFSKSFFTGWVVVMFIWTFLAAGVITFLPIWEGRDSIMTIVGGVLGKRRNRSEEPGMVMEGLEVQGEEEVMDKKLARERELEIRI
ncbi:urea active transporter [Saitoella coloradoensis]